jgi:hypothetical protein
MSSKTKASFKHAMELNKIWSMACNQADPTDKQMEDLLKNPDPVYDLVAKLFHKEFDRPEVRKIKSTWAKVYKEYFGLKVSFSKLSLQDGYDPMKHWAIIVPKIMSLPYIMREMEKHFKISRTISDSQINVMKNDRTPYKDYCVLVNKNVEADQDLINLTDRQLSEWVDFQGITLLERLLLEMLYYHVSRGKHLDSKSRTLCSGSHGSLGGVPSVGWLAGEKALTIDLEGPDDTSPRLRARRIKKTLPTSLA